MLLQPPPPGFKNHQHKFSFQIAAKPEKVWQWLNDPKTFTDNQVWPYKVEFYSPDPDTIPNGFHVGVLTNHTGPLINFAGQLTSIKEDYRDLQYFYGSYAIRFNWIRPYRLEFWTSPKEEGTELTCAISSYVRPSIHGLWSRSQGFFWGSFRRWSKKSIKNLN
ncbi:MAG: hypothetical protein AAFY41_01200 [Bacteroidota bacterium]